MAHRYSERVRETTSSTGTGNLTLLGAVSKYRTFAALLSEGDTADVAIVHQTATEWEIVRVTMTSGALVRAATVIASSTGSAVSFSAGQKDVYIIAPGTFFDRNNGLIGHRVYTTTGQTWTVPPGLAYIIVECIGGGGGGGAQDANTGSGCGAGGGGGGGYVRKMIAASAILSNIAITVGHGGISGVSGGTGGSGETSSFASHCSAGGGVGGGGTTTAVATPASGGAGGVGTSGDINGAGGGGIGGTVRLVTTAAAGSIKGGAGGSAMYGGGAQEVGVSGGAAGKNPGGGGAGGMGTATTGTSVGGVGGEGMVIVWEFVK